MVMNSTTVMKVEEEETVMMKKKKNDDDDEEHGETNNNNSRNVLGKIQHPLCSMSRISVVTGMPFLFLPIHLAPCHSFDKSHGSFN
mmetsp:Transcript_5309/g.9232  ORF Transcript_5309/g.9232 Transcript_5309/m.9232 type:complete len:86 (-) Transcript_5309:353-610(-)